MYIFRNKLIVCALSVHLKLDMFCGQFCYCNFCLYNCYLLLTRQFYKDNIGLPNDVLRKAFFDHSCDRSYVMDNGQPAIMELQRLILVM